jgi:hypothetical protein
MLRAFQWDLARQVERLDWLLDQLPRYADWGYNELYLHLEDAVEYPRLPAVARRDAYSHRQIAQLVNAAGRVGIRVVPIVNLLGHTQYLIKTPHLRDLNELRAPDGSPLEQGQVCPVHPRTLAVAEKLLRDVAPFCTAGKVHVGLDESFHLGKHPRSQKEIGRIGRAAHFARYVTRLRDLTAAMGLKMGLWADMLYFLPGAIPLLPRDVAAYEWYYYRFNRRPRVELFNFAESDVGERLRARGIEYWGCPMNGAFRFEPLPHFTDRLDNIRSWWRRCQQLDAAGFLVTSWEPSRLALELTTVVDAAAATLWLDGPNLEPAQMLERGFARVRGKAGRGKSDASLPAAARRAAKAAARAALACDRYPFGGYARWEINSRWEVVSRREPVAPYRAEQKHFEALRKARTWRLLPPALRASIELRWYLAARDVLVRLAQQGARRSPQPAADGIRPGPGADALRRDHAGPGSASPRLLREFSAALSIGERAARTMWSSTRDPHAIGPNARILAEDRLRLAALTRGEPILGPAWQLCYRVVNFAPAVQLIAVEQQGRDGTWATVQSCHTIEFQSHAARPRSGIVREHAAPVVWDGDGRHPPRLRLVLRGVGQVELRDVQLVRGPCSIELLRGAKVLGHPAPRAGWPQIDWTKNTAVVPLWPGQAATARKTPHVSRRSR